MFEELLKIKDPCWILLLLPVEALIGVTLYHELTPLLFGGVVMILLGILLFAVYSVIWNFFDSRKVVGNW